MIDKNVLDELRRLSKGMKTDARFEQRDERSLSSALNLNDTNYINVIERLLSCVKAQMMEGADLNLKLQEQERQIQVLQMEYAELQAENQRMSKEMETYNGVLLQRARVKAGTVKPAEKTKPTKEEAQSLLAQGFTRKDIMEKYGCSRSKLWRILKD